MDMPELMKPVIVHCDPIRVTVEGFERIPAWNGRTGTALGPSVCEGCTRIKFDDQHFVFCIKNEYLKVHNGTLPWADLTQEELQAHVEQFNRSIQESGLEEFFSSLRARCMEKPNLIIDEVAERFY